jgi:glycolate oxidase iron-sulfur subunit
VRYGEIITLARAALTMTGRKPGPVRRLLGAASRLVVLARLGALLRADRWLPRMARRLPAGSRWRTLAEQIPDVPAMPTRGRVAPASGTRGRVTLFRGCVASVYDRDTHAAARILLEAAGYEVRVPDGAPCCGALARHAGDLAAADRQSVAARAALTATGGETVLVSSSGCYGDLRDHASSAGGPAIRDVLAFLAGDEGIARLGFRPLSVRAVLHLPCTQVNVVGGVGAIRSLLARIPGLTVLDLPAQPRCCGAAGSYFLEHPAIAARLRDEKLAQAAAQEPDLLLTTNIGCRIHLANGQRGRADAIPVLHPLALLAQQLENRGP